MAPDALPAPTTTTRPGGGATAARARTTRGRTAAAARAASKIARAAARRLTGSADGAPRLPAAGDGGDDRHLVARLEGGLVPFEEADVFLVDVDVDEAPDRAALLDDAIAQPGKLAIEVGDHVPDGARLRMYFGGALGHRSEGSGDAHDDGHLDLLVGRGFEARNEPRGRAGPRSIADATIPIASPTAPSLNTRVREMSTTRRAAPTHPGECRIIR